MIYIVVVKIHFSAQQDLSLHIPADGFYTYESCLNTDTPCPTKRIK